MECAEQNIPPSALNPVVAMDLARLARRNLHALIAAYGFKPEYGELLRKCFDLLSRLDESQASLYKEESRRLRTP